MDPVALFNKPQYIQTASIPVAAQPNLQHNLQPVIASDSSAIQKKNKNKEVIKYASIGAAIIAAIIAIIKRKQISEFFTNINNKKKPIEETISIPSPKTTIQQADFPEPNFCSPGDLTGYEAAKVSYIKEIWPYLAIADKSKNIAALEAISKYGTAKDIDKLPTIHILTKDQDMIKAVCKTVREVGEPKDFRIVAKFLNEKEYPDLPNNVVSEILKSCKRLAQKGDIKLTISEKPYLNYIEIYKTDKNEKISKLANYTYDKIMKYGIKE